MSEPAPSLSDLRIDRSRFDHPSRGGRRWLFVGLALVAVALLVAFLLRPRPLPVTVAVGPPAAYAGGTAASSRLASMTTATNNVRCLWGDKWPGLLRIMNTP